FILIPLAVLFAAYTAWSDNAGIRYLMPVLPFIYLAGGLGLETLLRNGSTMARGAAVLLCAWMIVAAVGIYPDHLAYFNEAACLLKDPSLIGLDGGTRCGPLWLEDSNVDWGQGLKQLKSWLDEHQKGRAIRLAYFGVAPPEVYGVPYDRIDVPDLVSPWPPGLYVVSAHLLARGLGGHRQKHADVPRNWLFLSPPTAI